MLSRGIHFVFKESTVVAKESTDVVQENMFKDSIVDNEATCCLHISRHLCSKRLNLLSRRFHLLSNRLNVLSSRL